MDRSQLYLWWSLLLEMEVFFILSTTCTWVVMFFQFLVDLWKQHVGYLINEAGDEVAMTFLMLPILCNADTGT